MIQLRMGLTGLLAAISPSAGAQQLTDTIGVAPTRAAIVAAAPQAPVRAAVRRQRIDIVGGEPADIRDFPWQVALIRGGLSERSQFCGGRLFAPGLGTHAAP